MKLQRLYSYVRKAVDDYHMIEEGDKIAIGISGGKDSLTLLYALSGLRRFYKPSFEVVAITVDLGYEGFDTGKIAQLCEKLEVPYYVVSTEIGNLLRDNPEEGKCSLCAKMRKGALNDEARRLNCNKIAYAHHMDDVVETVMLSQIYEGRFYTFRPVTQWDRTGLTLIRPMIYIPVEDVKGFTNMYELPVCKNPCPYEKDTQRAYVRNLLREMNQHAPGVKKRMMTAVLGSSIPGWSREEVVQADTTGTQD